jgi:Zinc carboxypeptidase
MQVLLRATAMALAVFALLASRAEAAPIPPPNQYFGFQPGTTGKLARFSKIESYLKLIADSSNRVDYQSLGQTTLDHTFPLLHISSPANLQKVDEILAANERLANPRGLSEEDAKALAADHIPVYYLEAGMHSTEVGPVQVIPRIVHRLATEKSPQINKILNEMLIVVMPAANPDGSHLVTDYFNETDGTDFTRTYPDLYHHYTGHDDNRDWLFFTQKESKLRIGVFKQYRPVVEHILHQAGSTSPRMWVPPWNDGISAARDALHMQASNSLGMDIVRGLFAADKKGVAYGDAYGIWATADIPSFETFMGSALVLFEAASLRDLAFPYSSSNGQPLGNQTRSMRNLLPYDKSTWTLEQMTDYLETGVFLGLDAVAREPERWSLDQLYRVARNAVTSSNGPWAFVIPAGQRDMYAVYDLLKVMDESLVEIDRATAPFTAGGKSYPAGSYVLKTRQPLGAWVNQVLGNRPYPEAKNCPSCPLLMPYSEATDNLPTMLGVTADPIASSFSASLERVAALTPQGTLFPQAPAANGAYLVEPSSYGVARFLANLQKADVPTFRAGTEFSTGGKTFAAGTLVVPPSARARAVLEDTSKATGLPVFATDTAPQVAGFQLKPGTRVGLIRGANNMPGGWLMWQLDQHEVDYKVVSADDYDRLSALYDTILMPDGISQSRIVNGLDPSSVPERFHWARGVGQAGWEKLRQFVLDGGTMVAIGSSGDTAKALLSLPADHVSLPSPFRVPGSLMRVASSAGVPELWGMPAQWATWSDGDTGWRVTDYSKAKVGTSYPNDAQPLLAAGYAEGDAGLRGLADIVTFDVGEGHVMISATDLNFRTWPRVAWTVVANAIYHGPSTAVAAPGGAPAPAAEAPAPLSEAAAPTAAGAGAVAAAAAAKVPAAVSTAATKKAAANAKKAAAKKKALAKQRALTKKRSLAKQRRAAKAR